MGAGFGVMDRSRQLLGGAQIASQRAGFSLSDEIRGVHRPNRSQLRVERCSEDVSEALSGSGTTTACCC